MMRSSNSPAASSTSRLAPTGKIDAVGLDRDVEVIKERLCQDANELQILPIVGTGGIGKTTLARNVYHDSLIIGRFDILAWVTVSQDYSFGDIFSSLLVSMKDFVRGDISGLNNREKAEKVRQTLLSRRYLIVIDDMWSTKSWDEVRIYLPDDSSGSRIMLTTRLEDVAAYADSLKRFHEMKFLDANQSWDLLQKQVFKGESPPTLENIGREIAESCGGLPLAVVVIAGLLSEVSQTEEDWKQIANNINLAITADVEKYSAILSLSYDHLSHQLRQCFLYMGAFPEDYEIRVSKLIKLWIAEGFVEWTASKTPEEAAEECLEDLVKRNLVLVTKRKSNGRIKSCGLHDLLHDLCLIKSLEENFLLCFMGSLFLPEIFDTQLRISISHSNILAHIDGSTIRTIMCYGHSSVDSFERFSLLRILDMLNTNVPNHVFELRDIVLLAFSSSSTVNIPASILNLQNLQTLTIYPNNSSMVHLPVEIWKMSWLRHLVSSSFHPLPHPEAAALPLENLQTLSMATNFVCSERMVEMIPNVKKLGICYSREAFDKDYHLDNLQRFDHLEKLKLEMRSDFPFGPSLNPVFPKSLRKLSLSGWRRPWKDLSIIGSLPNLQVLKLRNYACDGSIWETTEKTFENLEFLLIDESNLEQWVTESSYFPMLKCLMLHRCLCLSEIPDDIGYIPTLELIEVKDCNQSLVESAKKIQKDQEMEENYSIQVRYSNALSSSTHHQSYNQALMDSAKKIQKDQQIVDKCSIQVRYSNAFSTDHQVSECVCLSHLNKPATAYETLDMLQQSLTQILKHDDDLTTRHAKRGIISIHDKVVVLQLNLKGFPEKETIREVACTTHEIIEYLFSPENLSDCGSIEPSVRVSNQLRELAEKLDSIVGDVVDYCKINDVRQLRDYPPVSSPSSSAFAGRDAMVGIDEDPTVLLEPIVRLLNRLGRLAENMLSTLRELADYSRSNDYSVINVRGLNDSSRSVPASNDVVVGSDEDPTVSMEPTVRLTYNMEILAGKILSSPGDLAYYFRSNDDSAISVRRLNDSSRSAPTIERSFVFINELEDPTVSHRLGRLAEKILPSPRDLAYYFRSNVDLVSNVKRLNDSPRSAPTSNDVIIDSDEDLRYSPTSEDGVVGLEEDLSYSPTIERSFAFIDELEDPTVSHRLGRLAEKILPSPIDLADYFRSNDDLVSNVKRLNDSPRSAPSSNDVIIDSDEDLSYSPTSEDVVVGLEEDMIQIMDRLTSGSPKLEVLPIVGMGGIGKRILAKIVWDTALIRSHFDICVWITVSQDFRGGNALLNLLYQKLAIKGKGKEIPAESYLRETYNQFRDRYNAEERIKIHKHLRDLYNAEERINIHKHLRDLYNAEEIREHLRGRRYLIVMDNIWSTEVWDGVGFLFPDNDNGSRVILTTRLRNVAASIAGSSSDIHMMRFLDEQQSWHLFQRKVFSDQTCPLELQSVAKKIVRNCGGLPLSIIKVAELLSSNNRTPKFWEQIVATNWDGELESILSFSYNHLPKHLKESFVYIAGFPEDYEIHVSELIKLWVAEGFLEGPYKSKSLEETAEEYLKELVGSSLVLVTSWKIDGKIKSCRLHNMVRDFCVRQAGQKKLLLPVKDYLPSPILRRHFLPQVLKNHRRISVSWYDLDLKDSMYSSYPHAIICIPHKGYRPKGSVRNFRSLKVLHVLRRNDHSYWELGQVFDLIHLRYLASNIPCSIVPPAISKLQNLQTLIIYRSQVSLPMEIWRLQQLRHLMAFSFHPLPQPEAAALPLENLQTLSLATNLACSRRMVKIIPNVKKLGICYSGEKFDEDYHLDNLTHLLRLEKLKLEMCSGSFWPSLNRPVFPVSLKKLTLSGCRLPWRDMRIVGWLTNLQVLKLRNYACDGEYWKTNAGEFDALRVLLIDESNMQQWLIESSSFPRLECLMLHRCPSLSEIPVDMGKIPTLRLIEVDDLNQSILYSAKMIERERREHGNEIFQVRLKRF